MMFATIRKFLKALALPFVGGVIGAFALVFASMFISAIPFFSGIGALVGGLIGLTLGLVAHGRSETTSKMSKKWLAVPVGVFGLFGWGLFAIVEYVLHQQGFIMLAGFLAGAFVGRLLTKSRSVSS